MQKTAFFAKIPSPRHFCEGKFFRDRTMRKLSSRGFRKCGTFGSSELFNGSYWCSKSTDFEIFGLSPKIRGVTKKRHGHNFEISGTKRIAGLVHPMSYLGYSFQARKIKIVAVSFFCDFILRSLLFQLIFLNYQNLNNVEYFRLTGLIKN